MAAFKQHLWAEWREQRGNLLGLWAGLVLLIVAVTLFGGSQYLNDPRSPIWFAALGSLAFTMTVSPRIFASEDRAGCKSMQRRTPGGVHVNFLAKALLLNIGLVSSALIPLLTTIAAVYWIEPRTVDTMWVANNEWADFAWKVLPWHTVPLILLAWGLPWRWAFPVAALAILVLGGTAFMASMPGASFPHRSMFFPVHFPGKSLALFAIVAGPWIGSWAGYVLRKDVTHLRRGLACLGVLTLVQAPALGVLIPRSMQFFTLELNDAPLFVMRAQLAQDRNTIYASMANRSTELGLVNSATHAIRIDLAGESHEDLGLGYIDPSGYWSDRWFRRTTFPFAENIVFEETRSMLPWTERKPPEQWIISTESGLLTRVDPMEPPASKRLKRYPSLSDLGCNLPWSINSDPVGLGYRLQPSWNQSGGWGLLDLGREQIFYGIDLPFESPDGVVIRNGDWLLAPNEHYPGWRTFDPDRSELRACEDLDHLDTPGPVLSNGKVLLNRRGYCFLYDPDNGTRTPLSGGRIPFAERTMQGQTPIHSLINAPVADWFEPCLVTAKVKAGTGHLSLGWLQASKQSLTWFPWSWGNQVFGATDEHTVLYVEGSKRICSLDLVTGETLTIFPR